MTPEYKRGLRDGILYGIVIGQAICLAVMGVLLWMVGA